MRIIIKINKFHNVNVTECLLRITELTRQNTEILRAINEAFFAKNTAVSTSVSGTRYYIPSFINLENKINHLQDGFDNLVHAAQCGDAWLNYDGNSRDIVLQTYQQAPNPLSLNLVSNFSTESVDLFKDMLSPRPYLNFSCSELPENITQVVVKKIIPYTQELIGDITTKLGSGVYKDDSSEFDKLISANLEYVDLASILENYKEDTDYTSYDTIYDLNIRKTCGYGVYTIVSVTSDTIYDTVTDDSDEPSLDEYIKITIQCPVKSSNENGDALEYELPYYTQSDGYTKEYLHDGYILTNWDGSAKFEIVSGLDELQEVPEDGLIEIKLKVLNGAYICLLPSSGDTSGDYSILRFYSVDDKTISEEDRYIHVPLEEDQYVCLFISPLNSRVNVQSVYGSGLFINTYNLSMENQDGTTTDFEDYYQDNVSNIGDVLNELTTIMSPSITKFSSGEYEALTTTQPIFSEVSDDTTNSGYKTLTVVQINKHLDDSETVQTIRSLYSQKQSMNTELSEVEQKITNLNEELSQISFDDLSGTRSMYEAQLSDLKSRQNELSSSISKICDLISQSANNSTIPLENAKFRVRGYLDIDYFISLVNKSNDASGNTSLINLDDIIGIQVRYRYKNSESPQANVAVVNEFLFSEWTNYNPPLRKRIMKYLNGAYELSWTDIYEDSDGVHLNISDNVPKCNQLDIPITQGESVDIQARVLYIYGYPFTETTSGWSDIITVQFPDELIQDVSVLTIIEENNNDIETLRFQNILDNQGITTHVDDKIVDQDLTYFHKPENIASGFYTDERRIIPLRDKLTEMNNSLTEIEDLIKGTTSEALEVSVILDNQIYVLEPDVDNQIQLTPYSGVAVGKVASGTAFRNKSYGPVQMTGSIKITNTTQHTVYLYSVFPAARTTSVPDIRASRRKFELSDYYNFGNDKIVF